MKRKAYQLSTLLSLSVLALSASCIEKDFHNPYYYEYLGYMWTTAHGDTTIAVDFNKKRECVISYILPDRSTVIKAKGDYDIWSSVIYINNVAITDNDTCFHFKGVYISRDLKHILITGERNLISNDSLLGEWRHKFYKTPRRGLTQEISGYNREAAN